jgi:hypothetical protein
MVLQPISGTQPCPTSKPWQPRPGALPAWSAIAQRQKQCAESWWLVSQPDHAGLSGDIAANFVSPLFPRITPQIAKCVGLHDAGWAMFEAERDPAAPPMIGDDWKPRAFMEFGPAEFIPAWTGSIERAERECPAGGVMVSMHFAALAQFRQKQQVDSGADAERVSEFLERESARQRRLKHENGVSDEQASDLLKVVQFCDMLSLYLCSGAIEDVDFPQRFGGSTVRLTRCEDLYTLDPSPLQYGNGEARTVSLGVAARKYPAANGEAAMGTLAFLLR